MATWFRLVLLLRAVLAAAPASAADPIDLRFSEFYVDDFSIAFSDKLKALAGKEVRVVGYMAPPLKPEGNFVVLTRTPVDICPFCAGAADWPIDIVAVYLRRPATHVAEKVTVVGILAIGAKLDEELGFVSLLRLDNATLTR